MDVELGIRGLLRGFGVPRHGADASCLACGIGSSAVPPKVDAVSRGRFAARVSELIAGHAMLERVIEPMLRAREALSCEFHALHRAMLAIVREETVCQRLMTVPGVGALAALTFTAAVDDPSCFTRIRAVGAHFGLTPKRYQSGETDIVGRISKVGDAPREPPSRLPPRWSRMIGAADHGSDRTL